MLLVSLSDEDPTISLEMYRRVWIQNFVIYKYASLVILGKNIARDENMSILYSIHIIKYIITLVNYISYKL
jgi:hypothetical protein